jgi:type I restriction enzyme M protein
LDGLEAVELKLSEVLENNDTKRIDSEYFKKEYLTFIKLLKKIAYLKLEDISNVKGGKRLPLGENFSDEGIFYIRAVPTVSLLICNCPNFEFKKLKR